MTHKELKAGDVRQKGDQVQRTEPYGGLGPSGCRDDKNYQEWKPSRMIGEVILPSDLFVARFRRPL